MRLSPMTQDNTSRFGTAFTESIEAREGVTTGISAADRARTIHVAISPNSSPNDLARPGHVFPLRARKGGVLVRAGQTEASVDLAKLAGLIPAGVICEIMNEDGTMARVTDLLEFCKLHGLKMVTVADLIRYRMANERYVHRVGEGELPTVHGNFRMIAYESDIRSGGDGGESHIALTYGDLKDNRRQDEPVLVRVHTHCLAGNIFGSTACDCRAIVEASLEAIARAGRGALVYLHHTQRGYTVDRAFDPPALCIHRSHRTAENPARSGNDQRILRQVGLGGQILSDLGIHKISLLTNQPTHVPALQGFGIEIVERVPIDLAQSAAASPAK
jgi:3,4-dihydroxy 2-butanone 4-phosphate synthase/GTP cyclohydrolase II